MNRLTPLVRRRTRNEGSFPAAAVRPAITLQEAAGWVADARLFSIGWVGGLVFFGTLIA
jgi:hypothetical protein